MLSLAFFCMVEPCHNALRERPLLLMLSKVPEILVPLPAERSSMRLGYNTNGLCHHRWQDALQLLADTGYESVALTVDHYLLDPQSSKLPEEIRAVEATLQRLGFSCVIETGARFLLNPRRKHEPTLVSPTPNEREIRIGFLTHCLNLAERFQAEALSLWSGVVHDGASREVALERLIEGLKPVLESADQRNLRLAFEPEPGMLIATMQDFAELSERLNAPHFGLTLDVGHVHCLEQTSIPDVIDKWQRQIWNIHLEDMERGVHEHLAFGDGTIAFPPIFAALHRIGYAGGVHVELSRHSHEAPTQLENCLQAMKSWRDQTR